MFELDELRPFHLAFPVRDLKEARSFFEGTLGCNVGRSAERWVDFDFFGHQISAHLVDTDGVEACNEVDGDLVPVRHFGVVLRIEEWEKLRAQLDSNGADFIIPPKIRFKGQPGEQGTMFVRGPGDCALEFKAFRNLNAMFAT